MIIEIDTSLLEKIDVSIEQLVFLNLVKKGKSIQNQNLSALVNRVGIEAIQDLIDKDLVSKQETKKDVTYSLTEKYNNLIKPDKDFFDEFYEAYPVFTNRPDGVKEYLRTNVNKCRREYNKIVGKSKDMHAHILDCLQYETFEKLKYGKMSYMKSMWKWLVNHSWEAFEEQMKNESPKTETPKYGGELL